MHGKPAAEFVSPQKSPGNKRYFRTHTIRLAS